MSELIIDSEEAAEQDTERTLALLGVTREQILAELDYRRRKKQELALKRMATAQRVAGERRMMRGERGVATGYTEMMIDPISYHYWGQRLGYECWEDKQFRREYLRDNPASRVKTTSSATLCLAGAAFLKRKSTRKAAAAFRAPAPSLAHPRPGVAHRGRWA
jgi:hypothetical protein